MDQLRLSIVSFADMTAERAAAVGRAYDAHPALRPTKVGGDPARIVVAPSMEQVITAHGLPVEWLTVRRQGRWPDFEGGQIDLLPGRGGYSGNKMSGEWEFSLWGHAVQQDWLRTLLDEPGAVDDAAALVEDLVVAIDAAYGRLGVAVRTPRGSIDRILPGVFWLNYFGPAFVAARPGLRGVRGARELASGGVLVRTTDDPWQPSADGVPGWQAELRELFGAEAFEFRDPHPALPSVADHVAAAPGTQEMPWERWLDEQQAKDDARKHAGARRRLAAALARRSAPVDLPPDAVEWSTSFDAADWDDFATYLTRTLRGDLSAAIGRAVRAVVATAPLDQEDGVVLETTMGAVRLGWFIDDVGTVDVYVHGSPQVSAVCDAFVD
ncbi:hypothetical protein Cch01nite_23120 [Cellulomonas chitinilytica]|uniref:Uncharacterized protein n=1 Tax=Cellulomonas chitinilytica TaxID=398759 RepID=A0A919P1J1_9CELL|nr:hypothetical protein [Cellulomonas chitinilytica]GIG21588.1 hypothetical protein Cch01nite_23120 [Cellulomonas chitinilytica]